MRSGGFGLAVSAIALMCAGMGVAHAAKGVDSSALRRAIVAGSPSDARGLYLHLRKLQEIADSLTPSTRAASTPGYMKSVEYIVGLLPTSMYSVTVQPFNYPYFEELTPAVLERTAPSPLSFGAADFATMEYSGSGNVSGFTQGVDLQEPPGATASSSTSGCEAADFAGFTAGRIAVVQRGTCTFAEKAVNAQAAGAIAVVIYNEGQPGRTEVLNGTLGGPGVTIPVVGTSYAAGRELVGPGVVAHAAVNALTETRETVNVIAETKAGRSDRITVVGAHLDSVPEGPGIEDNGTGSAAILEIALKLNALGVKPVNKLRFAWWGAEEAGLLGSAHYVSTLTARDIKAISANLNFDMIGSPNGGRFVYDGDGSDTPDAGPNGSNVIETVFTEYFKAQNLATLPTAFDGRSDYGPFIEVGIPAGGLFTGAEDIMTPAEAALFGGTAGVAFDKCYHQACDDITNINWPLLDVMADAAAHAVLTFAMTTSAVNGTDKANTAALKAIEDSMEYVGNHLRK